VQATVPRPLGKIIEEIGADARVFIVGCGDCATRDGFGGERECETMAEHLREAGIEVTGWAVPPGGGSTCNPTVARALMQENAVPLAAADTVLVLACAQSVPALEGLVGSGRLVQGTQIVTGGMTGGGALDTKSCHFCEVCIAELTGGLCPHAFCPKNLLNGPCGGAQGGRCEVFRSRQCVWQLIYRRLAEAGRLDVLATYNEPADFAVGDGED